MFLAEWNEEKDMQLRRERELGFEDILMAISEGNLLDTIDHPNKEKYPNQKIFVVSISGYAYMVPFVITKDNNLFLKTIIPSRDATKKYIIT